MTVMTMMVLIMILPGHPEVQDLHFQAKRPCLSYCHKGSHKKKTRKKRYPLLRSGQENVKNSQQDCHIWGYFAIL